MADKLTSTTFSSTYKDDWTESDGYHRVLYNSGRALQAREVTQQQTITQQEIRRFGSNIFKEGAAVNPGGITINNRIRFVKLASGASLPSNLTDLINREFTGQASGIKAKVIEAVEASGSDPASLFVTYTDTLLGTPGGSAITFNAGEDLDDGTYNFAIQTTNTSGNPAFGYGTRISVGEGDFFVKGHFVYSPAQSLIAVRYGSQPTLDFGFKVIEDIVTVDDTDDLYDNQGVEPNRTAPGADRYRIRLVLTDRDSVDSDESFVYLGRVENGRLVDQVDFREDYNRINDTLALRTKEESGNYNVKPFRVKFEVNDSDNSLLDLNVSDGISYINGYRASVDYPTTLTFSKANDTKTFQNEVTAATYGNYAIAVPSGVSGIPNINAFEEYNLRDAFNYGGSTIGTARIRAIEDDGTYIKIYFYDVNLNAGSSVRDVRSAGVSASNYINGTLLNNQAVFFDLADNNLLFNLPKTRPQSISDVSVTVQRRFSTTTDSSGTANISLSAPGETFVDTNLWIAANADSSVAKNISVSGVGTTAATITNGPANSSNFEVAAYVNKSLATSKSKTLTETTVTAAIESDGAGLKYIDLGVTDIYDVESIKDSDSDGVDVSRFYTLDNGQRDNFYDYGRLVLNGGASTPTGNIFSRFRYFVPSSSGDFYSVNSYSGQVDYDKIPSHTLATGETVELRDVLDFRPHAGGEICELPRSNDVITSDNIYYQPKYVKLVINTNSELEVVQGPSSFNPVVPPTPENALELYNFKLGANTLNDSDIEITKIENRRYTMADISCLEERISDLEEVATLSLLELEAASTPITDSNGTDRVKAGFIVDNFKDHFFSNYDLSDYRAALDVANNRLRPYFWSDDVKLVYDSDKSTNTILKGDNVYVKYDHTSYINQPVSSTTEGVNPFSIILHRGQVTLSPSSDNWSEQVRNAARAISSSGDLQKRLSKNLRNNWNHWLWNWVGRSVTAPKAAQTEEIRSRLRTAARRIANKRCAGSVVPSQTLREEIGSRVVDLGLVPFMRSNKVYFKAEGLRPNSRVFVFFDGVNVANWVRSESFKNVASNTTNWGNFYDNVTQHPDGPTTLTTDAEGTVTGSFWIPNSATKRFRAGVREFKIMDVNVNDETAATMIATGTFSAQGLIDAVQQDVVSTRRPGNVTFDRRDADNRSDPLSQSFVITNTQGIFVTKVDLYFSEKSSDIPVQVQIRPLDNGAPSKREIIPGANRSVAPASVSTSSDASSATTIEFDEPVYLAPGKEYALVVKSESSAYRLHVAKLTDFARGSTEVRPALRSAIRKFFRPQDGSEWKSDQSTFMKFNLYRAQFDTAGGTAVLENANVPERLLPSNPLTLDSGSTTITVSHENHGFVVGDDVDITFQDSSISITGIDKTSIEGTRTILAADWTGYTFAADSSATVSGVVGGVDVTATQNIPFNDVVPNIQTLVPNATNADINAYFTTGKSWAGDETPYVKDATSKELLWFQNNFDTVQRAVLNNPKEVSELGANVRSLTVEVGLGTTRDTVSPVIDMQRASMHLINNVIDNQDSADSDGFNVPINFISELLPTGGSAAAKHITKPITLENTATGIKLVLSANRPSVSSFDVYYRVSALDENILDKAWSLVSQENSVPSDEDPSIFRDYEYLVGGIGGNLSAFSKMQFKIVFKSTNQAKVPTIRDLRAIALGV